SRSVAGQALQARRHVRQPYRQQTSPARTTNADCRAVAALSSRARRPGLAGGRSPSPRDHRIAAHRIDTCPRPYDTHIINRVPGFIREETPSMIGLPRRVVLLCLITLGCLAARPASACPFCAGQGGETLLVEAGQADMILFGKLQNPVRGLDDESD